MPIFLIIACFISVAIISLGCLAFAKNKSSVTNRLFFLFSIILAAWCTSNFLENWLADYDLKMFFLKLDFFLGPLVFYFIFLFLLNFPEPNKKLSRFAKWLIIPTLFISSLILTDNIIYNINFNNDKIGFDFGYWFNAYAVLIITYLLSAIIFQAWNFKKISPIRKMQVRYVTLGFVITSLIALIFNLFLQNKVSKEVFQVGNLSPIILIFCIYYAIARYHLMSIGVILRLGAIYTLLLTSITFIYVLFSYLVISLLRIGQPWNFVIPSLFITIIFPSLKKFLELITDKIFFKRKYKFSDIASQIESSIHEAGLNLDKTLETVNLVVLEALKVKHSNILILLPKGHFISRQVFGEGFEDLKLTQSSPIINYLNLHPKNILNKEELEIEIYNQNFPEKALIDIVNELNKSKVSIVVPIELKDKLIAVYLLGEKKSEDQFSEEDMRLLKHVAWELGFVIDNAKSYEDLKKLDEIKSNFISVVSHQLRTPVTTSQWNLELCLEPSVSRKEKDEAVKVAYDGTTFLARQLDQLITVLEIEEKEVTVKKKLIKIENLIDEIINENKINLKNKKIKITTKVNKDVSLVNGDENKIKKVLNVLMLNAISYSMTSGQIEITAKKDRNKKNRIILAISDNGIGISSESEDQIFKKFFRSPEAISMSPNGFGLGLFIAKKIINAHGGDIWFKNNENKGTTFFVSLLTK